MLLPTQHTHSAEGWFTGQLIAAIIYNYTLPSFPSFLSTSAHHLPHGNSGNDRIHPFASVIKSISCVPVPKLPFPLPPESESFQCPAVASIGRRWCGHPVRMPEEWSPIIRFYLFPPLSLSFSLSLSLSLSQHFRFHSFYLLIFTIW